MGTKISEELKTARRFQPLHASDARPLGDPLPPFQAREESLRTLGLLADDIIRELTTHHADLVGYLIWTPARIERLTSAIDNLLAARQIDPPTLEPLVRRSVLNHMTGLGPLDALLLDDTVTEIVINSPEDVMVERSGRLEPVSTMFTDEEDVRGLAQRLAARAGRSLTRDHPMVDARLGDGSRIAAVIPPVSLHTSVAIRRTLDHPPTAEDLLSAGALTEEAWRYLVEAVRGRRNMVIAGGAGSGKTHLMRLLTAEIPEHERLVLIEDVRELQPKRAGVVSLEATAPLSMHDLLVQALRLRPDRILVGEVRGGEALDLIEAMASGHPGSLTTVHSPGPGLDTVYRLARAALRSGTPLPFQTLCEQMERTIEVVVFVSREVDGRRIVQCIDELRAGSVTRCWTHPAREEATGR